MPITKELERLEKSQATLKEILKVNMLEPFKDSDLKFITTHMSRLRKHECWVKFDDKVTKSLAFELNKIFFEVIIANGFDKNALNLLKSKKNLRLIDASNFSFNEYLKFI